MSGYEQATLSPVLIDMGNAMSLERLLLAVERAANASPERWVTAASVARELGHKGAGYIGRPLWRAEAHGLLETVQVSQWQWLWALSDDGRKVLDQLHCEQAAGAP